MAMDSWKRAGWSLASLLVILIASCESETAPSAPGTINVDSLPTLTLHEESRIGSVEDPDYGFSRIGQVDVDREGNVYVFEAQDRQIRVYDREGTLVRRIGRSGDGPGEFSSSVAILSISGDTVWTVESFSRRLTLFDRTGRVLESVVFDDVTAPLHAVGQRVMIIPAAFGSDGLFIGDRGPTISTARPGTAGASLDTVLIPRVRFNTKGQVVDTIGSYPLIRSGVEAEFIDVGSSRYIMPQPPSSEPYTLSSPDGVIRIERPLALVSPSFRVIRLDHRGDTVRARAFAYRAKPYPSEVLDSAAARSVRRTGRIMVLTQRGTEVIEQHPEDSAAAKAAVRTKISFPEYQPPVQSYEITRDGALWLRREDMGGPLLQWIVLNREDVPLGQLELPRSTRIAWVRGDTLLTVERDSVDVPWLARYLIERH